ncbi:hypothetical protein DIPPA_04466 [Diplonema papillatum]|nr:hypothetical protein DIPPA_04466 [Diplonema papillatum]
MMRAAVRRSVVARSSASQARWCGLGPGPTFLFKERYNMTKAPKKAVLYNYNAALIAAAACDGIDKREEQYVLGLGVSQGLDESEIRSSLSQTWDDSKIEATIKAFAKGVTDDAWKGYLIYDCIRTCSADLDYSPEERQKVRKIAEFLDVTDDHVASIEKFVILQDQLMERGERMMKNLSEFVDHDHDDGF